MATGNSYRNGISKGSIKVERPFALNSSIKSSNSKSKLNSTQVTSNIRRSSPGSLGGNAGSVKDDAGG